MTNSSERFLCMLALEAPFEFDPQALIEKLIADYPQAKLTGKGHKLGYGPLAGVMLDFGDATVAIAALDTPMPQALLERAYTLNRTWLEAPEALSRHKMHFVISNGAVAKDFNDALFCAALVTLVATALSEMVPCLGLYWETDETLTEPAAFRRQAEPVQGGKRAAGIWTQLQLLNGPPTPDGRKTVAAISYGLRPFIGREIDLQPTTLPQIEAGRRLIGAMELSLSRGPVLKDGETFGLSADE
jgi:hypothetical protein